MFDKRNMTITRRAAASGPCLADRVWLTPRRLEPCKGRAVLDTVPALAASQAPESNQRRGLTWTNKPGRAELWMPCPNHCLQLVVSIVWLVKTN